MLKLFTSAKLLCGALAISTLAITAMPTTAEAGWQSRRNWGIGAGVLGGLAVGGLIAGHAYAQPRYYAAPVYEAPDCYFVRKRSVTYDGFMVVRRVRVCD